MKTIHIGEGSGRGSGRVGSGQTFCRYSRVGSGRVNVSAGRVGSGPRKVTRGQLCIVSNVLRILFSYIWAENCQLLNPDASTQGYGPSVECPMWNFSEKRMKNSCFYFQFFFYKIISFNEIWPHNAWNYYNFKAISTRNAKACVAFWIFFILFTCHSS